MIMKYIKKALSKMFSPNTVQINEKGRGYGK